MMVLNVNTLDSLVNGSLGVIEDVIHYLFVCPAYSNVRNAYPLLLNPLNVRLELMLHELLISVDISVFESIVRYIKETNLAHTRAVTAVI